MMLERNLRRLPRVLGNRILLTIIAVQLALVGIRTIHLYLIGFMSSDEATYVIDSLYGRNLTNRFLFDYLSLNLFRVLGIDSVSKFFLFLPLWTSFWAVLFILASYKIICLLTADSSTKGLAALSLLFVWSYAILSVAYLSETPALTMCAIGVYFWLRFPKAGGMSSLVFSLVAFAAAGYTREPYIVFPIAAFLALPLRLFRGKLRYLVYLLVVPLVALVIMTYSPLFAVLLRWESSLVSGTVAASNLSNFATSIAGLATLTAESAAEFVLGLFLGWNPVLFLAGIAGLVLALRATFRRRMSVWILFVAALSLAAFLGEIATLSGYASFFFGQGLSTLIRYSSPAVIAYLLFSPLFFEGLSERQKKIFGVILLGFTVASVGAYSQLTQSNLRLPYNAMSFSYEYGPHIARDYLMSNIQSNASTTIFIAWDWKVGQVYLFGIPGLRYYPSLVSPYISEDIFLRLHPAEFYVLSAGPLQPTVNESIFTLGLVNPPNFVSEIYTKLLNQTHMSTDNAYRITSVQLIFNVPTGHLLRVTAAWPQNQTSTGA